MATDDSDRIAASGRTVRLDDGEHTLIFGFLAMKWLEDHLGGLLKALEAFGVKVDGDDDRTFAERQLATVHVRFNTVAKVMACGLAHEFITTGKGGRVALPVFDDLNSYVLAHADPHQINDYAAAGLAALIEAMPGVEAAEEPARPPEDAPPPPPANGSLSSAFPGVTSTTSPLSGMRVLTSTGG